MVGNAGLDGHAHELLPMQPVDTGGAIAGSHDGGEYSLCLGDGSRPRIGYFDIFLPENPSAFSLLPAVLLGMVADLLGGAAVVGKGGGVGVLERLAKADAERVFLVGELVYEVAGVTPEGEIRVCRGGVEGGARASLAVAVEQISRVGVSGA